MWKSSLLIHLVSLRWPEGKLVGMGHVKLGGECPSWLIDEGSGIQELAIRRCVPVITVELGGWPQV